MLALTPTTRRAIYQRETEPFDRSRPISRGAVLALGEHLASHVEYANVIVCKHTLDHTEAFLRERPAIDQARALDWLRAHSGHCDCEVLLNVVERIDDLLALE